MVSKSRIALSFNHFEVGKLIYYIYYAQESNPSYEAAQVICRVLVSYHFFGKVSEANQEQFEQFHFRWCWNKPTRKVRQPTCSDSGVEKLKMHHCPWGQVWVDQMILDFTRLMLCKDPITHFTIEFKRQRRFRYIEPSEIPGVPARCPQQL